MQPGTGAIWETCQIFLNFSEMDPATPKLSNGLNDLSVDKNRFNPTKFFSLVILFNEYFLML